MDSIQRPSVGVQVIVTRHQGQQEVLLGQRRNVFGDGQWGLPGGHLEFGESFEEAARRELAEETGLRAQQLYPWKSVNTPYEKTHYVQIGVQVAKFSGSAKNLEPHRCSEVRWFAIDRLPEPLFAPSAEFLSVLQQRAELLARRDSALSVYMYNLEDGQSRARYVNYLLFDTPPDVHLLVRRGMRRERKDRYLRQFYADSVEAALDLLRDDITRSLRDGYLLYDVHGNFDLETVRSFFPHGTVAFRAVSPASDARRDDIVAELDRVSDQLPLFDL